MLTYKGYKFIVDCDREYVYLHIFTNDYNPFANIYFEHSIDAQELPKYFDELILRHQNYVKNPPDFQEKLSM
jgi:hypothetical protein